MLTDLLGLLNVFGDSLGSGTWLVGAGAAASALRSSSLGMGGGNLLGDLTVAGSHCGWWSFGQSLYVLDGEWE